MEGLRLPTRNAIAPMVTVCLIDHIEHFTFRNTAGSRLHISSPTRTFSRPNTKLSSERLAYGYAFLRQSDSHKVTQAQSDSGSYESSVVGLSHQELYHEPLRVRQTDMNLRGWYSKLVFTQLLVSADITKHAQRSACLHAHQGHAERSQRVQS